IRGKTTLGRAALSPLECADGAHQAEKLRHSLRAVIRQAPPRPHLRQSTSAMPIAHIFAIFAVPAINIPTPQGSTAMQGKRAAAGKPNFWRGSPTLVKNYF